MHTVDHRAGTARDRRRAGQEPAAYGADVPPDSGETGPLTDALYVRLPHAMAEEIRARAAAAGQGGAAWVRDRIASSLRRPRPRPRGLGRAPTPAELELMVTVQEMVSTVGLALGRAAEIEARRPRPDTPRAGYADTVPPSIEILRTASKVLVDLIGARDRR